MLHMAKPVSIYSTMKRGQRMLGTKWMVVVGAILGALGVCIGAMVAHSLPISLKKAGYSDEVIARKLDNCEVAVRYQMYHAIAIFALGLSASSRIVRPMRWAAILMFAGVVLFSGGLYCIVFLDNGFHWSIVPAGGSLMIVGWIVAACAALFAKSTIEPNLLDVATHASRRGEMSGICL
jgi:uncharacterized membrane protein YgdD (TMEM256/DUF423 family)